MDGGGSLRPREWRIYGMDAIDTLVRLVAYVYMYGLLIAALLLFVASFIAWKNAAFRRSWRFRSLLIVFVVISLTSALHTPIVITSPANHTIVHRGEKVQIRVALRPALLSKLFPWVGLDMTRCHTCTDWPEGVVTRGALTGSPYAFTVNIPKNQRGGELYVNAYAAPRMGGQAAMRSSGIGLIVK